MSKGLFIEWNADYIIGHQPTSGVRIIPVLKPGLDFKMNIPKRQEYCAKNGIPFELPMQNQPTGANPEYPPPTIIEVGPSRHHHHHHHDSISIGSNSP